MRDQTGEYVYGLEKAHIVQLDLFIEIAINFVSNKQKQAYGSWEDDLDEEIHITNRDKVIIICECGAENARQKRKLLL